MRAGNGQRIVANAQCSQHLGTMPDRQVALFCLDELGVVFENSGGHHHNIGIEPFKIRCALTDKHCNARFAQLLGIAAFAKDRSRTLPCPFPLQHERYRSSNSADAR